ncbi:MAG: deoxyribonuclease IV [Lentisphaeria bacterium]|nr:deoxyribonuclease IV [Lentisphaeria bacterium]
MLHIGCHLSASGGYRRMAEEALSIGADTFQFFTRNPRGGASKPLDPDDMAACAAICREHHFAPLVAHAPYTLNPCGSEQRVRAFARQVFADDLAILEHLPGNYYNFHPGSHVGQGIEAGIALVTELLNEVLKPGWKTTVLLEAMAGKGSEVGSRFEELKAIIDGTERGDELGVCLDTCHIFCAGYDVVGDLDGVLKEFDRIIGLDRLKAIHLNDSMQPFGSHKDRHEKIGQGTLGLDAIRRIISHPSLRDLPFILETPHEDVSGYAMEIRTLKMTEMDV